MNLVGVAATVEGRGGGDGPAAECGVAAALLAVGLALLGDGPVRALGVVPVVAAVGLLGLAYAGRRRLQRLRQQLEEQGLRQQEPRHKEDGQ